MDIDSGKLWGDLGAARKRQKRLEHDHGLYVELEAKAKERYDRADALAQDARVEYERLRDHRRGLRRELEAANARVRDLSEQARHSPAVSHHGMVRFLERDRGVPMDRVRELLRERFGFEPDDKALLRHLVDSVGLDLELVSSTMLTPKIERLIQNGVSGRFPMTERCDAIVEEGTIVTVVFADESDATRRL